MLDGIESLRVPPHSAETESALIGAVMRDPSAWDRISPALDPAEFYVREHRAMWSALCALAAAQDPLDIVAVAERLERDGKLDEAGGMTALAGALGASGTGHNAAHYASLVRKGAMRRRMIASCAAVTEAAYAGDDHALHAAVSDLSAISESRQPGGLRLKRDLMREAVEYLDTMQARSSAIIGQSTGFEDLDRLLCGLCDQDLILLAARPSMGKSTLAQNIAEHVADTAPHPVAYFSLEMSSRSIMLRSISAHASIPHNTVRSAQLDDEHWPLLTAAVRNGLNHRLHVDDTGGLAMPDLVARARRLHREHGGLSLIVVDYLQLLSMPGKAENRNVEVMRISQGLKALAKQLDAPVLALSQLNRALAQRADKRPVLSDLRDSGGLEQDADVVAMIYRDDMHTQDSPNAGTAEVIIAKNRNGPTGTVRLAFHGEFCRFAPLAFGWEPKQQAAPDSDYGSRYEY